MINFLTCTMKWSENHTAVVVQLQSLLYIGVSCSTVIDKLIKQANHLGEPNGACIGTNLRMYTLTLFLYWVAQNQLSMDALIKKYI